MTKEQIKCELEKGKALSEILPFTTYGQECMIFRSDDWSLTDVIYVPDLFPHDLNKYENISGDEEKIEKMLGFCYTGENIIEECYGYELIAKAFFYDGDLDWACPGTVFTCWVSLSGNDPDEWEEELEKAIIAKGVK